MNLVQYILTVSLCTGIFYTAYRLLFRKSMNFYHARLYLMLSVLLSLMIPLTDYRIDTNLSWPQKNKTTYEITASTENILTAMPETTPGLLGLIKQADLATIAWWLYIVIAVFFVLRMVVMVSVLAFEYRNALKVHLRDCILLYNHRFRNTFSFFRWIFIHQSQGSDDEIEHIIAHEKIHVNQVHSLDIVMVELLTAVMWFNPFIWKMKKALQLVHEYLADEGALNTGIDKSRYQALLINQAAEERLISLSSSFNNSLIKKRIIMMTKSKIKGRSLIRLMAVLPVAVLLFVSIAIFNGIVAEKAQASESLITNTAMNNNAVQVLPPDTIIKKTTIKKVHKDNPQDTIVVEKEEIIIGDDVDMERHALRHSGGQRHVIVVTDGDTNVVRHRSANGRQVRVHVTDADETVMHKSSGDSVKTVTIIRHTGGEDKVMHRNGKMEHSGRREPLYILDGEPYNKPMETINPVDIESISVIKGKDVEKYTKEDYDAVILITTKKGKATK